MNDALVLDRNEGRTFSHQIIAQHLADGNLADARHNGQGRQLEAVDQIDLTDIKFMLCLPPHQRGEGWSKIKVNNIERRYKMFLKLRVMYPKVTHVPTADIDHMWHWHILHTKQYREDCQKVFGHYLDHNPREQTPEAEAELLRGYERTKKLFYEIFGENLPAEHSGSCSPFPEC